MADDSTSNAQAEPHDDFDVPFDAPETGPPGQDQSPGAAPPGAQPHAADPAAAPPENPYGDLPERLATNLRSAGLKPVPGETTDAAYDRLAHHISRRNAAYEKEKTRNEQRHAAEIANLRTEMRGYLEPILRAHHARERQAQVELEAAQIPPRDSPEYAVWLQEEALRRDDERRRDEWERAQESQRLQAEAAVQGRVAAVDEAGYNKVAAGLGLLPGTTADLDFAHAYEVYSESAVQAARSYFPEASEDQIQEFIALSQQLDIRRAELNGVDIREVWKGRMNAMIDSLVQRGLVTRAQGQAAKVDVAAVPASGTAAGNGNGNGRPAPTVTKPGTAAATAPQPTVAQRVTTEAAAAARRGPSAVPGSARPTQLPGQLLDTSGMDEDDYVEAALADLLGSEEQRTQQHRKQR
jgi:hypothetical protein